VDGSGPLPVRLKRQTWAARDLTTPLSPFFRFKMENRRAVVRFPVRYGRAAFTTNRRRDAVPRRLVDARLGDHAEVRVFEQALHGRLPIGICPVAKTDLALADEELESVRETVNAAYSLPLQQQGCCATPHRCFAARAEAAQVVEAAFRSWLSDA
jgi:hypothetical protein